MEISPKEKEQPKGKRPLSVEEMIETPAFSGDTDEILKGIQTLFHYDLIAHLAKKARERYLDAVDFIGTDNDMASWLRPSSHVPPMALRQAYSDIAAAYRFDYAGQCQMDLGQNPNEHWEAVKTGWVEFFQTETEQLTTDGRLTRAILESCRFWRTTQGEEAQDRLIELLPSRYYGLEKRAERLNRERLDRLLKDRCGVLQDEHTNQLSVERKK